MRDVRRFLREVLGAAARGRGVVGASVIERAGTEPQTVWEPDSADEPAFLAYSITKSVTACLVLRLAEEGRLDLDDPVAIWFPDVAQAARISVRHLLNHTAGIPDYGGLPAYHDGVRSTPSVPWSFERFAAETVGKGLLFAPGQGFAYSNPGYMLVKRILEQVSGASFRALVAERVARPLGLRSTFVPESIDDLATLAPGASCQLAPDGAPRDVRAFYHPGWVSHGVVASTPSEIARFLDGLFHGRLLSGHSLEQMMQFVPLFDPTDPPSSAEEFPLRPREPSYGLGLMADPASPWGMLVGHNGGGPCYSASAFHAFDLGGASVCAMGAIEGGFSAEGVVAAMLDRLMADGAGGTGA